MSYTGIQGTVNFLTVQQAMLTNELTDIMTDITLASRDCAELADETSNQRMAAKGAYEGDITDPGYQVEIDDINAEYELKLANIQAWESELETQKESKETEIQATTSYKESFMGALKENIQKDHKYGGSQ